MSLARTLNRSGTADALALPSLIERSRAMANKMLFKSTVGKLLPQADTRNEAGGVAYAMPPKHMLAQYAATGCLNTTFYASADEQLATVLDLCRQVEPEFIARTALYARSKGFIKDLPALLCAVLANKGPGLLAEVFDRVIDDGRMLRNFVQIVRSGVTGRKSLGTLPKRLVLQWIEKRDDAALFRASVGNDPSLADIVKMVHPKPASKSREALFGYLIGRPYNATDLPEIVRQFEAFKAGQSKLVPEVSFQMLTSLPLTSDDWKAIARKAPWQMTRMNLNTFARHRVFEGDGREQLTQLIADRLRNAELIGKAKVFPYQLMVAYATADKAVPAAVRDALQDAMELAIANVPKVTGGVWVFPDISGSMHSPATGYRKGSMTAVRCIDIAALVAAAFVRQNPRAAVLPFESKVVDVALNPRDSVMTNAQKLAPLPAGGTNCSAPLAELNRRGATGDLLIYVSDNESWVDSPWYGRFGGNATETMRQWAKYKGRNPNAKLVCIDIQPYGTTQAKERPDVLNIGGFSDRVFDVIAEFANGTLTADHWVGVIEAVNL
jgi:60 kDa SS-A/Ro ribonucleoprotein